MTKKQAHPVADNVAHLEAEVQRLQEELASERMTLKLEKRAYDLLLEKLLTSQQQLRDITYHRDAFLAALSIPELPDYGYEKDEEVES
jgi:hypothetical protein